MCNPIVYTVVFHLVSFLTWLHCSFPRVRKDLFNKKSFSIHKTICCFCFLYSVFNEHLSHSRGLVGPSRLELPTSCLSGTRSNLLSYEPMRFCSTWSSALPTGGDDGIRTHDPLLAGQVLSQLSYTPIRVLFSCIPYRVRDAVSAMTYPPTPSPA